MTARLVSPFQERSENLTLSKKVISLGIQLRCARGMPNHSFQAQSMGTIAIATSLIACLVGLGAMYVFPAGGCTLRLTNSLGTAVAKGHLVDPILNAAYQSLRQLRQEAFAGLERVQHCSAKGEAMCDGPVAVTHRILRRMWHWQAPSHFAWEGRLSLGLLDGLESSWLHEIGQGMRLPEWNRAGNRRRDMRVIEFTEGSDKIATLKR